MAVFIVSLLEIKEAYHWFRAMGQAERRRGIGFAS
jgi:hypothetical protein